MTGGASDNKQMPGEVGVADSVRGEEDYAGGISDAARQ